jgi:catechol-2,3-dioxygenase
MVYNVDIDTRFSRTTHAILSPKEYNNLFLESSTHHSRAVQLLLYPSALGTDPQFALHELDSAPLTSSSRPSSFHSNFTLPDRTKSANSAKKVIKPRVGPSIFKVSDNILIQA